MIYDEDKRIYYLPENKCELIEKESTIAAYILENNRLLIVTKSNLHVLDANNDISDGW